MNTWVGAQVLDFFILKTTKKAKKQQQKSLGKTG